MNPTTQIKLTDNELILLDGKVNDEAQKIIEIAKTRISYTDAFSSIPEPQRTFASNIILEAKENGELTFYWNPIRFCSICGKSAGYAKYTRSGRYHRKGDPNRDRPLNLSGVELAKRFVRVQGYSSLGSCRECWEIVAPLVKSWLSTFPVQLPPQLIASPTQPLYTKQSNMKCSKCNWEGHQGEMGKLRTLMGDGWYAGKCPSCGVENTLFSDVIKPTEGYVLTENAPPKPLQVLAAPPTPERV